MSTVIAASRPSEWNFPLFVHVFGAMILVGGLLAASSLLVFARGNERFLRLGALTLLAVAFPGWIIMRVGAQWIYSREHWADVPGGDPTWLVIGFGAAEGGGLVLVAALITGGIGMRRLRTGGGAGLLKATMVISILLLVAYVVAIWAMSGKPG